MKGILPAFGLLLVVLGLVAVAIYETVTATQLSLPTAPLTIPTLLLPFLALANALYAQRVAATRQRQQQQQRQRKPASTTTTAAATNGSSSSRASSASRPILYAAALQGLQTILSTILATLLAAGAAPSDTAGCLLSTTWQRLYSAHDGNAIRRIQDRLSCCGLNTPRDRAWPFPRGGGGGGGGGASRTCEDTWARHDACRGPWASAMRWNAGVELAVVLAVTSFQLVSVFMLIRSSSSAHGSGVPAWLDGMFGYQTDHHQQQQQQQQRRRLLANGGEEAYTDRIEEEAEEEDDDNDDRHASAARGGDRTNGPRLEPSLLGGGGGVGGSSERNEWRDDA